MHTLVEQTEGSIADQTDTGFSQRTSAVLHADVDTDERQRRGARERPVCRDPQTEKQAEYVTLFVAVAEREGLRYGDGVEDFVLEWSHRSDRPPFRASSPAQS